MRYLPEQGLSVHFIQSKTNIKSNKVLVKPSFNKSEWVTDWSNLMISCFTSHIPFTLNKAITYVTAHCHYFSLNIFFLQVLALFAIRSILSGLKKNMFAKK